MRCQWEAHTRSLGVWHSKASLLRCCDVFMLPCVDLKPRVIKSVSLIPEMSATLQRLRTELEPTKNVLKDRYYHSPPPMYTGDTVACVGKRKKVMYFYFINFVWLWTLSFVMMCSSPFFFCLCLVNQHLICARIKKKSIIFSVIRKGRKGG